MWFCDCKEKTGKSKRQKILRLFFYRYIPGDIAMSFGFANDCNGDDNRSNRRFPRRKHFYRCDQGSLKLCRRYRNWIKFKTI